MAESDAANAAVNPGQALRRGLLVRLALASAALLALAVFTLDFFTARDAPDRQQKRLVVDEALQVRAPEKSVTPASGESAALPITVSTTAPADGQQSAAGAQSPQREASSAAASATAETGSVPSAKAAGGPSSSGPAMTKDDPGGGARASAGDVSVPESSSSFEVQAEGSAATTKAPARGPHLQTGVFLHAPNAQRLKAALEGQGLPVYIESRVHVGPFRDRKEAERMRQKLMALGIASVLVTQ